MMMTPQETLILRNRAYDKILSGLQRALAIQQLRPLHDSNGTIVAVVEGDEVPAFTLPIQFYDVTGRGYYAVDLRKGNREYDIVDDGSLKPRLLTETNFLINTALAQKCWRENLNYFNTVYYDSARVYAYWLGMKVAKRLALGPLQQNELICYFAYYYLTRVYKQEVLHQMEYDQLVYKIAQLLGLSGNEVVTILEPMARQIYPDLEAFCVEISKVNPNPKLAKFNRVLVQGLMIGSWLGINGRELVAVATEYPPVFMTMLYRAINERSFKDTDIAQVALRILNSTKQKQYNLVYSDILKRVAVG